MISTNEVTLTITLTEEEWSEVANAIASKELAVSQGVYTDEEDAEDRASWVKTLSAAYDKITTVLDKNKLTY